MPIADRLPALAVVAVVLAGVGVMGWKFVGPSQTSAHIDVKMPTLSDQAKSGQASFNDNCAACHGVNAAGSEQGPPLIHDIYNPGHHGDPAFYVAAVRGVRGHHWRFGNMPAQPQVNRKAMTDIIRYIREVQLANGISYRAHKM